MTIHSILRRYATPAVALAMTTIIIGCRQRTVFYHYNHTSATGWEKNDTLFFTVPPLGCGGYYSEEIGLRSTGTYPFQSLTLVIEQAVISTKRYNGELSARYDTLFCNMVSSNGTFLENGTSLYQYTYPLATLPFNEGDSLRIGIRHNMKREILPGIVDVGIKLTNLSSPH